MTFEVGLCCGGSGYVSMSQGSGRRADMLLKFAIGWPVLRGSGRHVSWQEVPAYLLCRWSLPHRVCIGVMGGLIAEILLQVA